MGGRGSKVQGFVCVLKGPLLGDNSPRGWALSSGLLAGSWVWGCRRPSVLNTGHLARAACAPGHKCPCRGRGPPAAPAGGHPRALSFPRSRGSSLPLGTPRPPTCLPSLVSSEAKAAQEPLLFCSLHSCCPFAFLLSNPSHWKRPTAKRSGTYSSLEPALLKLAHHSHRPPRLARQPQILTATSPSLG